MGISTVGKGKRQEVSTADSPGVKVSSPVSGKVFAEFFFLLQYNSGRSDRMIHLRKT